MKGEFLNRKLITLLVSPTFIASTILILPTAALALTRGSPLAGSCSI
jgi:hypothetical protein